jgi:kinesin family protein 6/9
VSRSKLSNAKDTHAFAFNRIFPDSASQQDLFEHVAKPVIDSSLDGYNGTIFAYGQTGSGKTFTMSGGDDWKQRGVIPRVLSYVFEEFRRRSKKIAYELQVSFIEIYNESAYDLLEETHSESNFENWTKVLPVRCRSCSWRTRRVTFR